MTLSTAETMGLKALGWLVNSPDDLGRFLNVSGAGTEELRDRASDPAFLGAVLDFLLADDSLMTAFCETESVDHKQIHLARHVLEHA